VKIYQLVRKEVILNVKKFIGTEKILAKRSNISNQVKLNINRSIHTALWAIEK